MSKEQEMTEINNNSESSQENLDGANQYIEALNEMKQNSVSKAAYDKLREENRQLLDTLVKGGQITAADAGAEKPDVDKLRKDLFSEDSDLSNLEYATKAVELRDALIEAGERDPFLPWGQNITPTQDDIAAADRVADVLKDCIEYAEGDSQVFTNELMRRTVDINPVRRKK